MIRILLYFIQVITGERKMKLLVTIYNQAGFKMADKIVEFSESDVQVLGTTDLTRIAKESVLNDIFAVEVEIIN